MAKKVSNGKVRNIEINDVKFVKDSPGYHVFSKVLDIEEARSLGPMIVNIKVHGGQAGVGVYLDKNVDAPDQIVFTLNLKGLAEK